MLSIGLWVISSPISNWSETVSPPSTELVSTGDGEGSTPPSRKAAHPPPGCQINLIVSVANSAPETKLPGEALGIVKLAMPEETKP